MAQLTVPSSAKPSYKDYRLVSHHVVSARLMTVATNEDDGG